uniref:Sortase family protein n=1 Tax=Solibacter usitatus (strain Ellin6076) TaxID=234267 RepID=Q01WM4_SOLUE
MTTLVGKLEVTRLHISAMVREGVDEATLAIAAGRIPHTALPGTIGNVGIAAHRDTLFHNLKDVRLGDEIKLTTLEGEYVYRVVSRRIVAPSDVWILDLTQAERVLTLLTCYPFYYIGSAPWRFIVGVVQVQ